jgi:hypothetical protein
MARSRRRRPSRRPSGAAGRAASAAAKPPGARVARVSVDDKTWAAFRELCGTTPASIRLGELVRADVKRAKRGSGADATSAIATMRRQLDALEAQIVAGGGELPGSSR